MCCTIQIDFVTWLFCLLYDCYIYSCTFICVWFFFTRDWTLNLMMLFIQWKFHESCRQFASVNWSVFLVFFVDIYLRCWTSMQLILNLKWNYDAQTQSHVLCKFCYCYYFCFIFEQKLQSCDMCTCKWCLTLCTELLCIVCVCANSSPFIMNERRKHLKI